MARKKKRPASDDPNAELLPPREALSLLNTDPSAYTSLMANPTDAGAETPDPSAGAAGTADSAKDFVDAQASGGGDQTVSDQPQTITTDDTQTASSET